MNTKRRQIIITKRIAKHGRDTIIVVPKHLSEIIKPGMLTQLTIDILDEDNVLDNNQNEVNY
ncbi:MAG: hypothetical protein AABX11_02390 [Nanoarchaeota archaeon]